MNEDEDRSRPTRAKRAEEDAATMCTSNGVGGDGLSTSPSPGGGTDENDDDDVAEPRGRLDVVSRALLERSSRSSSSSSRKSGSYDSAGSSSSPYLSAVRSDVGGTFAVANRPLRTGDLVLECESACGVALDAEHRSSRCGFCAARVMAEEAEEEEHTVAGTICGDDDQPCHSSNTSSLSSRVAALCGGCRIVSFCIRCREAGASRWHVESGECRALAALVRCFGKVFLRENFGSDYLRTKVDTNADADEVDSTYVLAVRLLCRRWTDEGGGRTKDEKTEKCSDPSPPCPLPPVDWALFDALHATKLTPDDDDDDVSSDGDGELAHEPEKAKAYGVAMDRLCRLMREDYTSGGGGTGGDTDADASPGWIDRGAFDEVMGRVVGCSHAVTDVTLDLGCQCLGRALFIHHSFYNHECAPNAFLSCFIVDGDRKDERYAGDVDHCGENGSPTSSRKDSHTGDGSLLSKEVNETTTIARDRLEEGLSLGTAVNDSVAATTETVTENYVLSFEPAKKRRRKLPERRQHKCALMARVHCLRPIRHGKPVTLSYIPTSGLDRAERRRLLHAGYRFYCRCSACSYDEPAAGGEDEHEDAVDVAAGWERALRVPQSDEGSGGIDALREVQHSCNRALLRIRHGLRMMRGVPRAKDGRRDDDHRRDDDAWTVDLANCLATLRMTANGVRNQRLPSSHEVSVESHRLLATGLSLSAYASAADCDDDDDYDDDGRRRLVEEAIVEHESFLRAVEPIRGLFDPVAVATQRVAFAADLRLAGACSVGTIGTVDGETTTNDHVDRGATKWRKQLDLAFEGARNALGFDHPFVLSILRKKNLL